MAYCRGQAGIIQFTASSAAETVKRYTLTDRNTFKISKEQDVRNIRGKA